MTKAVLIGLDLLALGLLIAYWEWRHQVYGWGRGLMHNSADRPKHVRYGWFANLEDLVWGPPPTEPNPWDEDTIRVSVRWDLDVPLPEKG